MRSAVLFVVVSSRVLNVRLMQRRQPLLSVLLPLLLLTFEDGHDIVEEGEGFVAGALEDIAAHDRAEAAAGIDGAGFIEQGVAIGVQGSAGEDDDATAIEGALDDVGDALGQGIARDTGALVDFGGCGLLQVGRGELHLDDVGAELGSDLGRVRRDIETGLAFLAQSTATGISPEDDRESGFLRFGGEIGELFILKATIGRARVDRVADSAAAQADGIVNRRRAGAKGIFLILQHIVVVEFEDERDLAGVIGGDRLDETQGSGVGIAAGIDRELDVIAGIVGGWIGGEGAGGAMLEALIDREDDKAASPAEATVGEKAGEIGEGARVLALVVIEDFGNAWGEGRGHRKLLSSQV